MSARDLKLSLDRAEFDVYSTHFNFNFSGEFNVYNVLASVAAAAAVGLDIMSDGISEAIQRVTSIPGRMPELATTTDIAMVSRGPTTFFARWMLS